MENKGQNIRAYLILIALFSTRTIWALPQFARKYNVSCNMCHSAVPKLNEFGYKFRAIGFRMPNEMGEVPAEGKSPLENWTGFRAGIEAYVSRVIDRQTQETSQTGGIRFDEAAIHPVTGSWGRHWGTSAEFAITRSGEIEIEQSYARYVFGEEDSFGSIRAGIFHALEGFGAADRTIGISSPLIQSSSSFRDATRTLYTPLEPSAAGITAAYWFQNTYATLNLLNRIGPKTARGEVEASYLSPQSQSVGDVAVSINHIFDHKGAGSGVSVTYYLGQSTLPIDSEGYAAGTNVATYKNNFHRVQAHANYFLSPRWNVMAGAGWGKDQAPDATAGVRSNLESYGCFVGLERYWDDDLAAGARVDRFKADTQESRSTSYSIAVFTNYLVLPQLQLLGEYRFLHDGRGTTEPRDGHSLTAKIKFAY